MKKLITLLIVSILPIVFYSCDDVDNCKVDRVIKSTVYITNSGFQYITSSNLETGSYPVYIYKGGYNNQTVNVGLAVADSILTNYNKANGTSYSLLPSQYYTIGKSVILNNTHYCDSIKVSFNDVSSILSNTYVLPLVLTGVPSANVNQSMNDIVLVHLIGQ